MQLAGGDGDGGILIHRLDLGNQALNRGAQGEAGEVGIRQAQVQRLSIPESFIIGLLGMLCLLPGMSFPAIILFLVMSRGVSKQSAIKFTYIIMVPILLGMTLGNWYDTLFLTGTFTVGIPEGIAAMVAGLTGFVGIHLTKTLIEKRKYHRFAIYCAVVILLTAGALLLGM